MTFPAVASDSTITSHITNPDARQATKDFLVEKANEERNLIWVHKNTNNAVSSYPIAIEYLDLF